MTPPHNLCYWPSSKMAASRYDMFTTWEERAFAEDSGGDLGSIWPPRSYSCSFCGREFRSAQALGGHMNVHRRDRARLKQSQSSQSDEETQVVTDHHDKEKSAHSSVISRSDSDRGGVPRVLSGSLLPVKRSAVSDSDRMVPSSPYWSPLVRKREENKGSGLLGIRPSSIYPTIVEATKNITSANLGEKPLCNNDTRIYVHRPAPSTCCIVEASNCKRAKISDTCMLPRFLFDRLFADDYTRKLEVTRVKVENREEIDLELRLGNPPEVK